MKGIIHRFHNNLQITSHSYIGNSLMYWCWYKVDISELQLSQVRSEYGWKQNSDFIVIRYNFLLKNMQDAWIAM